MDILLIEGIEDYTEWYEDNPYAHYDRIMTFPVHHHDQLREYLQRPHGALFRTYDVTRTARKNASDALAGALTILKEAGAVEHVASMGDK